MKKLIVISLACAALVGCSDDSKDYQEKLIQGQIREQQILDFCKTHERLVNVEQYKKVEDSVKRCEEYRDSKSYKEMLKRNKIEDYYTCAFKYGERVDYGVFQSCVQLFKEIGK